MEIKVTNLQDETIEKLDALAKKKGISREELLHNYFTNIAIQEDLFSIFSKYEKILNRLENSLSKNTEVLKDVIEYIKGD